MSKRTYAIQQVELEKALDEMEADREGCICSDDPPDFPPRPKNNYVISMVEERHDDSIIDLLVQAVLFSR